jgi:hypothetical protein
MPPLLEIPGERYRATIWSVDDAWFSGNDPKGRVFPEPTELPSTFDALKRIVVERRDALQLEKDDRLLEDLKYLEKLVEYCSKKGIGLNLAPFELLEEGLGPLNKRGHFFLMDVNYHRRDKEQQEYGLQLMERCFDRLRAPMKPEELRCSVAFVTARPVEVAPKVANRASRAGKTRRHWKAVDVYDKSDRTGLMSTVAPLETLWVHLDADVDEYLLASTRIPAAIVRLLGSIMDAARVCDDLHPMVPAHVAPDLPGAALLAADHPGWDDFKALYWYVQDSKDIVARNLRTSTLQALFDELLGTDVRVEFECGDELWLPVQPGIVFLVYLLRFLECVDEERHGRRIKFATDEVHGRKGICLSAYLTQGHEFGRRVATATRDGRTTTAFRPLVDMNLEAIPRLAKGLQDLADSEREKLAQGLAGFPEKWQRGELIAEGRFRCPFCLSYEHDRVEIRWAFPS